MPPLISPTAAAPSVRSGRRIAVVGGGPAGMTSALLLARAGHRVVLHERQAELGGLWASQRDADGFFLGDNSCKVYQPSYSTTPALFRLLGADWADHFVPRHDLTRDWLRPFVRDSSARDLMLLGGAFLLHASGLESLHTVSVDEFMTSAGISEPCRAWMRATALGGIAGTLRMTMWELFHRLGQNLDAVLVDAAGPLWWNARPPNSERGFLSIWTAALRDAGVELRLGERVRSLTPRAGGGIDLATDSGVSRASVALLALPPPALASLLSSSDERMARGFGRSRSELEELLGVSRYEHLGITWFFDRAFARDLPLGGHNVRRGWHPILVQHDQYSEFLRPPAVTTVVGSVALDTPYVHARLGTRADAHNHDELARILWEDERLQDPSLPEPIGHHIAGVSAASQIVDKGPLPMRARGIDVILASSLHGRTPYFTASLESAIQAGALAAEAVDERVEKLPMRRGSTLPWDVASRGRRVEVVAELPCSADEAWRVFIDTDGWKRWSRYVVLLRGDLVPGAEWDIRVRGTTRAPPTRLRPRLLSVEPRRLVFESRLRAAWIVRMEHAFIFEDTAPGRSVLRQPFAVTGTLAGALWRRVRPALEEFAEVGTDLARFLEARQVEARQVEGWSATVTRQANASARETA